MEMISLLIEAKKQGVIRRLFLCGPFASINYTCLMSKYELIDGILIGYCENTALNLSNSLRISPKYTWDLNIHGGVWRNPITKEVIGNIAEPDPIPLKELPLPARDIEMEEQDFIANLEFSRGCDNHCAFCHVNLYKNMNNSSCVQIRSVDKVIEDIRILKSYNKQFLIFNDSIFWRGEKDTTRITELCNRLLNEKIEIYFMIYLSLKNFPPKELMELLVKTGLVRVFIGVESYSEQIVQRLDKSMGNNNFEYIRDNIFNPLNLSYHVGYIVFYPFTTFSEMEDSINYLIEIKKIHRIGIIVEKLRLLPNTELHKKYCYKSDDLDIAYKYNFDDPKTELVFMGLNEMFKKRLDCSYRKAEVMCTSITLLQSICGHFDSAYRQNLEPEFSEHVNNIEKYQKILQDYILSVIDGVKNADWSLRDIIYGVKPEEFENNYWDCFVKLELSWGKIIEKINNIYNRNVEWLIFKGDE